MKFAPWARTARPGGTAEAGLPAAGSSENGNGSPPLLRVADLHKRFGRLEVLQGVTLDVTRGETVTVIGPSGSGKTTFLRCLNYLERPSSGHIWIEGRLLGEKLVEGRYVPLGDRELAAERTEIGFVFQRFNLWPHLTALGNVSLGPRKVLRMPREAAEEIAREQLVKVGLEHKIDEYPERLSGGQQQRVAIARALAMRPKLLLFDEPTSSLDPELIGEVLQVMRQLAAEGRTMIVVTHEMQFAADAADRVIFMEDGRVIEDAPPSRFFQNSSHPRIQSFINQISVR